MKMNKLFAMILCIALLMNALGTAGAFADGKKLSIVTTIFPIYDWVRQIVGDNANVEITLLLDSGVDLHSYQPTAKDILKISTADLFIYVGGESDEWAENVLETAQNPHLASINMVEAMGDAIKTEEIVEGMEHEHEHEHEHEEIEPEDIEDRSLAEFAGEWKSLYPILLAGDLDAFCAYKAESDSDDDSTKESCFEKYKANWNCVIKEIKIEGDTITFTDINGNTCAAAYTYAGYTPVTAEDGDVHTVRYQFTTNDAAAPKYVQFNDHGYKSGEVEHFHIYFGSDSFEALADFGANPFFVPAELTVAEIIDELTGHDAHDHEHHDHDHEHEEEADEHVWLSLRNAQRLVQVITDALERMDAANAEAYQANAAAYIKKLAALDAEYQKVVDSSSVRTVLFGDRFPFRYLTDDYGLTYFAAFSGCSAETEASFQTILFLVQKVDELGLPAVLTIEGANHKIAETIIQTTAQKHQKLLTLNSMQGITAADVQAGATYLSLMQANLDVLKEALN